MGPQDETINKPLAPHWTTSMQAYYNPGSTSTPFLNPHAAGSYLCHYMWPNQANDILLQCDALHDPTGLSNKPTIAGDAALAFSEIVHRTFGEKNLVSIKRCARNLQPKSLITKESKENGNRFSIPENDRDEVSWSAASGSKGSPDDGHGDNNDFTSNKQQQANSTEPNENLGAGLNISGTNAKLTKLEEDEIRRQRKRQSNRESAKRSRMRKQQECEELHKNMDILKDENSLLTQRLKRLSDECLELRDENDSIEEELVKMYGPESIADLFPMKPA